MKIARQATASITAATVSSWVSIDATENPVNCAVAVILSANSVLTYTVEYCYDTDVTTANSNTIFAHPYLSNQSSKKDSNLVLPCSGVRLNVTGYSTGSAQLITYQSRRR